MAGPSTLARHVQSSQGTLISLAGMLLSVGPHLHTSIQLPQKCTALSDARMRRGCAYGLPKTTTSFLSWTDTGSLGRHPTLSWPGQPL